MQDIKALDTKCRPSGCIRHARHLHERSRCAQLVRAKRWQQWRKGQLATIVNVNNVTEQLSLTHMPGRMYKHVAARLWPLRLLFVGILPAIGDPMFAVCHWTRGRVLRAANIQNIEPSSRAYATRRSLYRAVFENINLLHVRRTCTEGRAPSASNSRQLQSPVTSVEGTGVNNNRHVSCNVYCMSRLLLSVVAVVQTRPLVMASFSSSHPYRIICTRNVELLALCTSEYFTGLQNGAVC